MVQDLRPYRPDDIELAVFEDNLIGRRFYDAYGFLQVDRRIHAGSGRYELGLRLD